MNLNKGLNNLDSNYTLQKISVLKYLHWTSSVSFQQRVNTMNNPTKELAIESLKITDERFNIIVEPRPTVTSLIRSPRYRLERDSN